MSMPDKILYLKRTLRLMTRQLMVNCFTLVTPTFDPLGLYLHPFPALINHSCDYNAVVRVGGRSIDSFPGLQVVPLRPISEGEEILISYVDATFPTAERQKQLRERYFFECNCRRCSQHDPSPLETFITEPHNPEELVKTEARAIELLESAKSDTSMTGPMQKLRYAIYLLRQTQSWPLQRHPYPSLRHQFILACLDAHQFNLAFAHAAVQRFKTDPDLMHEKYHPIRMVQDWFFVRLMDHIMDSEKNDWAAQKFDLLSYKLDLSFWRSYIIDELHKTSQRLAHCEFNLRVYQRYYRLKGTSDFIYRDSHKLNNKEKYAVEMDKMENMMEKVLELEGVWIAAG